MEKKKKRVANPNIANETSEQKLVRLGDARVNKISKAIKQLGNLGRLKPSTEQTDGVFSYLKNEFDKAEGAWRQKKDEEKSFHFPSGAPTKK